MAFYIWNKFSDFGLLRNDSISFKEVLDQKIVFLNHSFIVNFRRKK